VKLTVENWVFVLLASICASVELATFKCHHRQYVNRWLQAGAFINMVNKFFILCLLLTLMMTSCIVGTKVSIINKAKDDKSITVHYPTNFRFPITLKGENQDSLPGYDISKTENSVTSHDYYRYPAKVHITN
jgi:hypothetical protein